MSGFLGRAKKTFSKNRRESSGSSSQPEIHVEEEAPELPVQEEAQVGVQQHPQDEGIYLINSEGAFVRRRGRATCRDIKELPHGTRVNIDVNDDGIPCNYPETNLLASYMGVIVKDSIIAPISFADWRNPGMEPYKKLMATEVEAKFAYPTHIRPWIRNSLGVKWRNYKTSLKNKYWDGRPIEEVINNVPEGVDHLQWATLVTRWNEPRDKERAAQNTRNAQQQKCPHTMGRTSEVRRQQETMTQDRLLLWKMNRLHKDGSWTSDDVRQKWEMACQMLAASGLTPEDENVEENERVLKDVMGAEHPGRVRCKGFGVTPSKYHPQSSTSTGCSSAGPSGNVRYEQRFTRLEGDVGEIKGMMTKMFELINKKIKRKEEK